MPTNRTKRTRKSKPKNLPDNIRVLLESGQGPSGDLETFLLQGSRDRLKIAWDKYKDEVLADWIKKNPCSRPYGWWEFDAPENRLRVGGTGTADFEVLAHKPNLEDGIPSGWVSKFQADYYNGRSVDIHGKPIGTEFKEGDFKGVAIDPNNPPRFESIAAYLDRLNFLTSAEKTYLKKHPELMEPERVEIEE